MIGTTLAEAWSVYRRLWKRSVVVAGLVFAVVGLAQAFASNRHGGAAAAFVALILSLVGGLLVQGALVEVVRDLHEGRAPDPINAYYSRTRGRLGTLLGTSLLYGLGVLVGLVLLVIPGLIAIARWSLIVPLVMIEGLGWRDAFRRSSELVRGKTGSVLVLIFIANLVTLAASGVVDAVFGFLPAFWSAWIGGALAGAVAVPYEAHVLTVLYYKLTEPDRLVLPPESPPRETWHSIWDEEPPA